MTYKVYKNGNFIFIESSNNRDIYEIPVKDALISRAENEAAVYNFYNNGNSILSNIALYMLQDESGTAWNLSDFEEFRTKECGFEKIDTDEVINEVDEYLNASIIDVKALCPRVLLSYAYNNGTAGVGATLTAPNNGAFPSQDGVASALGNLYLVKNQLNKRHNGVYELTVLGDGSNPAELTRVSHCDETGEIYPLKVFVQEGTLYKNNIFAQKTIDPVIGTSNIVFDQINTRTSVANTINNFYLADTATSSAIGGLTYSDGSNAAMPGTGATISKAGAFPTLNSVAPFTGMIFLLKDETGADEYMNGLYMLSSNNGTSWSANRYLLTGSNIAKKVICISNSTSALYGKTYICDNVSITNQNVGVSAISFSEAGGGDNFANADLTFSANRTHDLAGYKSTFDNAELKIIADANTSGDVPFEVTQANGTTTIFKIFGNSSLTSRGNKNLSANTFYGENAGLTISSGNGNTGYGFNAGSGTTTGTDNVYVGVNAGSNNNGARNVLVGSDAGTNTSSANNVVAIGYSSGTSATGSSNTLLGAYSGVSLTSGGDNTFVGVLAGLSITTGEGNTIIGSQEAQPADLDNSIVIGKGAVATADNQLVIGSSVAPVGNIEDIGTFTPTKKMTIKLNGVDYYIQLDPVI